jgi:hypothetical protein
MGCAAKITPANRQLHPAGTILDNLGQSGIGWAEGAT